MVAVGAFVLDAPGLPFAEGVVGPVPAIFLEEVDAVADVGVRTGSPGDCAELADVDAALVLLLEGAHRFQPATQPRLVENFAVGKDAGVGLAERVAGADALVRVGAGVVHVDFVDYIVHREGREVGEGVGGVHVVGFDEERGAGIDGADNFGAGVLHLPVVAFVGARLEGFVGEVVAVDAPVALEARCDVAPGVEQRLEVHVVIEETPVMSFASAGSAVQIHDDEHPVFSRQRQDDALQMVEATVQPRPPGGDVGDRRGRAVRHLEAQEGHAPVAEGAEIGLRHVAAGRHDAAMNRSFGYGSRIPNDVVLVRNREGRGRLLDGEGAEVETGAAGGFLESEEEVRLVCVVGARVVAEFKSRLGHVAETLANVFGIGALADEAVVDGELELEPLPVVLRARNSLHRGAHGEAERFALQGAQVEAGRSAAAGGFWRGIDFQDAVAQGRRP